jgi:hypothetical protein
MNRTAELSARDVGREKRNWGLWLITIFLILPVVLITLYTWAALHYAYSSGERAGYGLCGQRQLSIYAERFSIGV